MKPRTLKDEEGNSLIEAALSMAVLLTVLFGILEACLGMYFYNFVCESARLATRYATVRGATCAGLEGGCPAGGSDIDNYVRSLKYPAIEASRIAVTATWPSGDLPGHSVIVRVQYQADLPVPFTSGIRVNLASTSQAVISQ